MKQVVSVLCAVLFIFILPISILAAPSTLADRAAGFTYDTSLPRVIDKAELLTAAEEKQLNAAIKDIITTYSFDIVIITVKSTGGKTAMAYADDYYDYNGYGYGQNADGLLFLIDMGNRDYQTSTAGTGLEVFTDDRIERLGSLIQAHLSEGDYYTAFSLYLNEAKAYLESGAPTGPFDPTQISASGGKDWLKVIGISLAVGFIVALIIVSAMKKKMNTAVPDNFARAYVESGSFQLTNSEDRFLYRTTTRVKVQQNTGAKGGGSHVGSSGRSHGGGGGKF